MRPGPVKLGPVSIHPGVIESIGATRLGCELEAYGLGVFCKQASPRRILLVDSLANHADALSVICPKDAGEVWFVTSLGKTEVFVPKPLRGQPVPLPGVKICCNPTAARLLTPAQISAVVLRHRRGDWGAAPKSLAECNESALQLGNEVKSIFRHFRNVEVVVISIPELMWVSVDANVRVP